MRIIREHEHGRIADEGREERGIGKMTDDLTEEEGWRSIDHVTSFITEVLPEALVPLNAENAWNHHAGPLRGRRMPAIGDGPQIGQ